MEKNQNSSEVTSQPSNVENKPKNKPVNKSDNKAKKDKDYMLGQKVSFQGIVTDIMFRSFSDDNPYAIFKVTAAGKHVICKGQMPRLSDGVMYKLTGTKRYDTKRQEYYLELEFAEEVINATPFGIIQYLVREAPGIGPTLAAGLVKTFQADTLNVLANEPDKALVVPGYTKAKATAVSCWLALERSNVDIKKRLYQIGLTTGLVQKILLAYGPNAEKQILKDCFKLKEIHGIGFATVCKIANLIGIPKQDANRIKAGIMQTVEDLYEHGDTCFTKSALISAASKILEVHHTLITEQVDNLIKDNKLVDDSINASEFYTKFFAKSSN